ncbi:MAG: VPLPA-CTERM sorting domain-containing protein [Paracoccaceae bacterium]
MALALSLGAATEGLQSTTGMLMKSLFSIGLLLTAGLSGQTAAAATVTFDFSAANSGSWQNSLTYTTPAVGLTVSAASYANTNNINATAQVQTFSGLGLGVLSFGDISAEIDGRGRNDLALFTFNTAVSVTGITFAASSLLGTEYFDIFTANGGTPVIQTLDLQAVQNFIFTPPISAATVGIGAYYSNSSYYISSLTVSYPDPPGVPLPAAGWALMGAVGALVGLKRRKRSRAVS